MPHMGTVEASVTSLNWVQSQNVIPDFLVRGRDFDPIHVFAPAIDFIGFGKRFPKGALKDDERMGDPL